MNAPMSSLNLSQIKREADAIIGNEVLGPAFCRYATSAEATQSEEGQRYLHHLAIWMTTAAAAHVRLGTRDLVTVTQRFGTGIVPLRGAALVQAIDQFAQAIVAVNPDLGVPGAPKLTLSADARRTISSTLLHHPSFAYSAGHAEAVRQALQAPPSPATPAPSRPRGP